MQLRLFGQILPGVATASVTSALALAAIATITSNQPSYAGGNKFSCAKLNGVPVTMVRTSRGNETFIRWKDEYFSKSIDRMSRCQAVTDRFQRYVVYTIATVGDSASLKVGDRVFVGGFTSNLSSLQSHRGVKDKFVFTSGQISLLLDKPLEQGYQIGYTNDVRKGMSGGPLLNNKGEVVGINSLHKDPVWDTPEVYKDGSEAEQHLQDLITRSSMAVPIRKEALQNHVQKSSGLVVDFR